jgi:hypothetical protein
MGNEASRGNSSKNSKNIFSMFKKKKVEPITRRDPMSTADEILQNSESLERVQNAVKSNPPFTSARWEKILHDCNVWTEPTEDNPDPLRLVISLSELKKVLFSLYDNIKTLTQSDGLNLMREFIPKLYDKHSTERGKRLSQQERNLKNLADECFAYGELPHEIFATMYLKVASVYGAKPTGGAFCDLGCGVGILVTAIPLVFI